MDLVFRHSGRARPILEGASISLRCGDRVLLEGRSGTGKSTLASLLAALRLPDAGLVLLEGLDQWTLGERPWRKRVALAPQFHENHVFTETLAFNLLMGRDWPPGPEDLAEAEELCRELGLGELLARMPSGLQQVVGETGWQLSHGERSRVFMARALLQGGRARHPRRELGRAGSRELRAGSLLRVAPGPNPSGGGPPFVGARSGRRSPPDPTAVLRC